MMFFMQEVGQLALMIYEPLAEWINKVVTKQQQSSLAGTVKCGTMLGLG